MTSAAQSHNIEHVDHADGVERSYLAATTFGHLVFPCGQIPTLPDGTTPEGIAEQTRACLDNLERSLQRCGSGLGKILQITVYLADPADFEDYDAAWRERFTGIPRPPRTSIFVAAFRGTKRIEISAIAVRESGGE
ncbi:MAG: RidA family protein [Candidatus Nanopelagicales bacterium]|nr:RidA family protein [Candidatus Nanopelagicales bacterium]